MRSDSWKGSMSMRALRIPCMTAIGLLLGIWPGAAYGVIDVALGEFYNLALATNPTARVGTMNGLTVTTVSCNVGNERVDWLSQMDPRHPMIAFALYRLENNRLEQVGISWTKHGFFALDQSLCNTCTDPNGGSGIFLGVNCSDTYSTSNNSDRTHLGPRSEINPWTAGWTACSSYFDNAWGTAGNCTQTGAAPSLTAVDHRMLVDDTDIDPALHASAIYYTEGIYMILNDANRGNNIGWRRIAIGGTPGAYTFTNKSPDGTNMPATHAGRTPQFGPAVASVWGTDHLTLNSAQTPVAADGEVYVATTATDLGGGNWHYEYAVYNYNFDKAVHSFSVPISPCATVTNGGFRDWIYSVAQASSPWAGDVNGTNWSFSNSGGAISWTDTGGANPLRWGQLYNFWFDANMPPAASTVTIATAKPSTPSSLSGAIQGPSPAYMKRDVNGDGVVNAGDVEPFVDILLNGTLDPLAECAADVDDSGGINGDDVQDFVDGLP